MNISKITEKRLAEQLGTLVLENTKLQAIIQALSEENNQIKARFAELESPKANGEENTDQAH